MLNRILFTFLCFILSWSNLIAQDVKNYCGDFYQNCSWIEGAYLSANKTAFSDFPTFFTNHVVHIVDLKNGVKIDSSGRELIGFLFQYEIILKDTVINNLNTTNSYYIKDSIIHCSTEIIYWRDPKTGIITNESFEPYTVHFKRKTKKNTLI